VYIFDALSVDLKKLYKEVLEVIDFVEHVFTVKNWKREITKNKPMLDKVFKKIGKQEKQYDSV
jgi:DNA-binding transcriptional regulator GbsR (MarR family)